MLTAVQGLISKDLILIASNVFYLLKPQVPKVEKVFFTTALPVAGNTGMYICSELLTLQLLG